jgi:predicted  nucleic acid-binding Zn-ribbon protein
MSSPQIDHAKRRIADLGDLQRALEDAVTALEQARINEDAARKATTSATNRVNQAQKAMDDAVAALRDRAPRESDWRRRVEARRGEVDG